MFFSFLLHIELTHAFVPLHLYFLMPRVPYNQDFMCLASFCHVCSFQGALLNHSIQSKAIHYHSYCITFFYTVCLLVSCSLLPPPPFKNLSLMINETYLIHGYVFYVWKNLLNSSWSIAFVEWVSLSRCLALFLFISTHTHYTVTHPFTYPDQETNNTGGRNHRKIWSLNSSYHSPPGKGISLIVTDGRHFFVLLWLCGVSSADFTDINNPPFKIKHKSQGQIRQKEPPTKSY